MPNAIIDGFPHADADRLRDGETAKGCV